MSVLSLPAMDPLQLLIHGEASGLPGPARPLPPIILIKQRAGWRSDLLLLLLRYDVHYRRGQLALFTASGARVALLLAPSDNPGAEAGPVAPRLQLMYATPLERSSRSQLWLPSKEFPLQLHSREEAKLRIRTMGGPEFRWPAASGACV